jgi:hypothetical protein
LFPDRDRDAVEQALEAALEAVRIGRHVHERARERAHVAARELGRVRVLAGRAFPLTFLCNVFVPAGGLSAGLREIAEYNPVSAVVAAVRELFGNPAALPEHAAWPLRHPVAGAFAWSLLIAAIAAPLAVRRYRIRTTG